MSIIEPRTSTVVIYQGDFLDRIRYVEDKYDAAVKAEKGSTLLMGEIPESQALYEEHKALVTEAEKTALHVKIRAVRRSTYRELADQHPPRKGEDIDPQAVLSDAKMAVNEKTFRLALVPIAIVDITQDDKTTSWDDMSEDDREEFLDTITEANYEALFIHAYSLVNGHVAAPKPLALPASLTSPESAKN